MERIKLWRCKQLGWREHNPAGKLNCELKFYDGCNQQECKPVEYTAFPTASLVERDCPDCGGKGFKMWMSGDGGGSTPCPTCGGSGKVFIVAKEEK